MYRFDKFFIVPTTDAQGVSYEEAQIGIINCLRDLIDEVNKLEERVKELEEKP